MKSRLIPVIIASIGSIAYFSCRRTTDISFEQNLEQRFFTMPANTSPVVKTLAQKIKGQKPTIWICNERCVKNVIGSNSTNGIGLYVSTDAPEFQTWTLLNN